MMLDNDAPSSSSTDRMIESAVHLDMLPDLDSSSFAFSVFEREDDGTRHFHNDGTTYRNMDPVIPSLVSFDAVEWCPLSTSSDHRFLIKNGGKEQAFIEVSEGNGCIHRIVVVKHHVQPLQSLSSPSSSRPSTIVEFSPPHKHVQKLATLVHTMTADEFYLPLSEVVVGSALRTTRVHVPQHYVHHPRLQRAEHLWHETLSLLGQVSALALEGSRKHNVFEVKLR